MKIYGCNMHVAALLRPNLSAADAGKEVNVSKFIKSNWTKRPFFLSAVLELFL